VVLGALIVLGAVVALARRGNAGPVLFCAAVFVIYYGFLKFSPLLNELNVNGNAQRLHYAVYVTIPAVIALMHLRAPRRASARARPDRGAGRHGWRRGALMGVGCVALAGCLLITNNSYWTGSGRRRPLPAPTSTASGPAPASGQTPGSPCSPSTVSMPWPPRGASRWRGTRTCCR
jgi:hypothetical protein